MSPDLSFLDLAALEFDMTALMNILSKLVSLPPEIVNPK